MGVIHLEGMGLLGSLLARQLALRSVEFTWHDPDPPGRNAWRASTGLVYPAGDDRSQRGLAAWHRWLDEGWLPEGVVEPVGYVYAHRHPPHEGRYTPTDLGDCRVAPTGSAIAVNVPRLVRSTRVAYSESRLQSPGSGRLVRSHGFNARLGSLMWGWAVRVTLGVPERIWDACDGLTPAFYSRMGRFQIVYAYPIPGTGEWWAGSTLVAQRRPRELDVAPYFGRWVESWRKLWPTVPVTSTGESVQAWRPRPAVEPADDTLVVDLDGVLTFPPLWHSGVRWGPLVIEQALAHLV